MVTTDETYLKSRPWLDLGEADIAQYVTATSPETHFDLVQKLEQWQRDGIVIFEQVVSHDLIDELLGDIEHLRKHTNDYEMGVEFRGDQRRLRDFNYDQLGQAGIKFNQIHLMSRAASLLSLTPTVTAFLRHLFLIDPAVLQSLAFMKGSQQPIHVDYPYVNIQTQLACMAASWIPLEDIHADSGPLAYYPGSHNTDISGFFDWGKGNIIMDGDAERTPMQFAHFLQDQMTSKNVKPKIFLPKKGDVLIWHANVAHEGTPIKDIDRTRKSYVTHYTALDSHPQAKNRHHAMGTKQCVSWNGGWVFLPWGKTTDTFIER